MAKYYGWPEKMKSKFIIILGGRTNYQKTKELLEGKRNEKDLRV